MKTLIITILFLLLALGLHAQITINKVSNYYQNDTIDTNGVIIYMIETISLEIVSGNNVEKQESRIIKKLDAIKPAFHDLKDFIYHKVSTGVSRGNVWTSGIWGDASRRNAWESEIWGDKDCIAGVYYLCYKPKKSGFFKIPPIEFEFQGKKYSTQVRNVVVRKAEDNIGWGKGKVSLIPGGFAYGGSTVVRDTLKNSRSSSVDSYSSSSSSSEEDARKGNISVPKYKKEPMKYVAVTLTGRERYHEQVIKFDDSVNGKLFWNEKQNKYFITHGKSIDEYYQNYEAAIKALYIYKKYGVITNAGQD